MLIVTLVPCERKKHEMDNIDKERNEQVYSIVKQKENGGRYCQTKNSLERST